MKNIKEKLYHNCISFVAKKLATVNQIMNSNQNALQSETKSSAGDKHETGRAMLQLEMEKASQQFVVIKKMKEVLQKIDIQAKNEIVKLGALVYTTKGIYFLSISIGEISFEDHDYFVVSPSSPIGQVLLGKGVGDEIHFNESAIKIIDIA